MSEVTKSSRWSRPALLLGCACWATLGGCALWRTHETSSSFSRTAHRRVGLLVTRMGNRTWTGVSKVTLSTNYANRTPKKQSEFGLSENFVDVYVEDEGRLREAIPTYPSYEQTTLSDGPIHKQRQAYYGNITPQLYRGVASVLSGKGYEVADVRELSKTWETPLSEMTIDGILARSHTSIDALAVLHYTDMGDYYANAISTSSWGTGLTLLSYTLAVFDARTKEQLLFYRPLSAVSIADTMANDPEIANDPALSGKIKKTTTGQEKQVESTFSADEVIGFAVKYVCHGTKAPVDRGDPHFQHLLGVDALFP